MGLDMWFKEDEQRILATLTQTARRLPDNQFLRGYLAAINDVALAHGLIRPGGPGSSVDWQRAVNDKCNTEPGGSRRTILIETDGR